MIVSGHGLGNGQLDQLETLQGVLLLNWTELKFYQINATEGRVKLLLTKSFEDYNCIQFLYAMKSYSKGFNAHFKLFNIEKFNFVKLSQSST